jgi:hypothetical protein
MATPTSGDANASVTMSRWETRALEIVLVVIGAGVLLFAGFVTAFPLRFGTATNGATTSTGPVTLSHLTTVGTTPTVVTEVTLASTSSASSGRTTDSAWLGTIFGIGTLIILSGALYRRVTSVSGFGVSLNLSGVVNDPETQAKIQEQIKTAQPDATPQQAMRIYSAALSKLQGLVASRLVIVGEQPPKRPPGVRERLSILADRTTSEGPSVAIGTPAGLKPTDAEISQAVDEATAEVLRAE